MCAHMHHKYVKYINHDNFITLVEKNMIFPRPRDFWGQLPVWC